MSDEKFEKHVNQAVRGAVAAAEGNKEIITAGRAAQQEEKRKHRDTREKQLGAKQVALPNKRYGLI
jgi:hypothetical protein